MDGRTLEVSEVSMTIVNGAGHALRAERIARLTFDYLRELMERDLQQPGGDILLAGVEVAPITVSLDSMSDEEVARASAEAIHQMLSASA